MRFHVVSLPHTQTTEAFSCCAYTEKVRKFCKMMKGRGHSVFLYAGGLNAAPCDEWVTCITESERRQAVGEKPYVEASFDWSLPHWQNFNQNTIEAMRRRIKPQDFICLIAGIAQKQIADAFPNHLTVEFGIGYGGSFANFRVWESYAWMHACYGSKVPNTHDLDGKWFDCVIPNYFEPELFPFQAAKGDYYLFMGRLVARKGAVIAADVCERLGKALILAGLGEWSGYGTHVGIVGPKERGGLMAGAKALFCPTQYIEPFGGVAVEAMMCGTPAITTDWGAFPETVIQGKTGFRCRTLQEFVDAAEHVGELDAEVIRRHAVNNYSLEAIAPKYEAYFERLNTLWHEGWYSIRSREKAA